MANRTAQGVLNLQGYEISCGRSKEKRYYFHAVPKDISLKTINFYTEFDSERERYV